MGRNVTAAHEALRNSEHNHASPDPTHHVVAVSPEGETLWVTESYYAHEPETPQVKFADDYSGITNTVIDDTMVSYFDLREA